jgi:hypothetical protein
MADPIHIALIDDDASILDSLQLYFERRKLKVSCFNSSNEFTAAVDGSAQFDCVVSDVRMPGMQLAVAPPTSSHGAYRRRAVEQGNRNAAQPKCENRQQPPSMGYGANWRPKSRRTCADGNNHPGAAIESFSIPLDEAAPACFSQGSA